MASFLRSLVSAKRVRFQEDGFDLDVTYITDQIIAMGLPSTGVEKTYRNPLSEVSRMLEKYHSDHYMVYNVSERSYDYSAFQNCVLDFGWPDHHAPTLQLLLQACQSLASWLDADPKNVAAVHCKAGKGRTGTLIASYLMYSGRCSSAEEAIALFARSRSKDSTTVLRMASQQRYVHYLGKILAGYEPHSQVLCLRRVIVSGVPNADGKGGCQPLLNIYKDNTELVASSLSSESEDPPYFSRHDGNVMNISLQNTNELMLRGNVMLCLFHKKCSKKNKVARFGFHTGFISDGVLRITKKDIDGGYKDKRIPEEFFMDLFFETVSVEESKSQADEGWVWKHIVDKRNAMLDKSSKLIKDPQPKARDSIPSVKALRKLFEKKL